MRTVSCGHQCGTKTRRLSLLSYWPSGQRPRYLNRFLLTGQCWLNGRRNSGQDSPYVACWRQALAGVCFIQKSRPDFPSAGTYDACFSEAAANGNGAKASLIAKFKHLLCDKSFPMMRRLFGAVVKPTVSYGCEVWGSLCSGNSQPGLKGMAGFQIAFFRQH